MLTLLFIGAHNKTGDTQWDIIRAWANFYLGAYTLVEAHGYWHSAHENSTVLLYSGSRLTECELDPLKQATGQHSILVIELESNAREV